MKYKMYAILFIPLLVITLSSCHSATHTVVFKLDMKGVVQDGSIGIRGSISPLSWDITYPFEDIDQDGIYEAKITFKTKKRNFRYKFINGTTWELPGSDNRTLWFKDEQQIITQIFNEYDYYKTEKSALTYTKEEIEEDVATLEYALKTIHPNLYKYQSQDEFEASIRTLKKELLASPKLNTFYTAVSKFAAKIKCSHTFTNPWNQGPDIEKQAFFQPDKLPITFSRIGKRIFIDRNASANQDIKKGMEILSIDDITSQEIMTTLSEYVTSDGANYEKKLNRLTMTGLAKFELFDIFYPLIFGSKSEYKLILKDHTSGQEIETTVQSISKTSRTFILKKKDSDFDGSFEQGWKFELINNNTAYLKMSSFAIFSTDFKWKNFLNNVFDELKNNNIDHFIIDIRGNEGGDAVVAKYVLERIINKPIKAYGSRSITSYRKIPDDLKTHISTWDKRPYDWGSKVDELENGKFKLNDKFEEKGQTFKPKKGGYKGKSYLLVDAANSSATQLMAMYTKTYKLATIIGQETGGNLKGLNGGYIFFFRMPHSRIELDIPVFGITVGETSSKTYNGGVQPDIYIEKKVEDLINDVDTELKETLLYINSLKQ